MSTAFAIALICSLIGNVITGVGGLIIDLILMYKSFMPTDTVGGLLDIAKEPFVQYLPYVNWFIPLDYAVSLVSAFLDAYAMYIVWKYFKKVISSLLGSGGNIAKLIGLLLA